MKHRSLMRIMALAMSLLLCMQPLTALALEERIPFGGVISNEAEAEAGSNEIEVEVNSDETEAEAEVNSDGTEAEADVNSDETEAEAEVNSDGTEAEAEVNSDETEAEVEVNSDETEAEAEVDSDETEAETEVNSDGTEAEAEVNLDETEAGAEVGSNGAEESSDEAEAEVSSNEAEVNSNEEVGSDGVEAEESPDEAETGEEVGSNGTEAEVNSNETETEADSNETELEVSSNEAEAELIPTGSEVIYFTTTAPGISTFNLKYGNVELADGTHEEWIKRVQLPQYAIDVYNTLSEESFWLNDSNFSEDTTGASSEVEHVQIDFTSGTVHDFVGLRIDSSESLTIVSEYVTAAMNALDRDHPEIFWLEGKIQYLGSTDSNGKSTTYLVLNDYGSMLRNNNNELVKSDFDDMRRTDYQNVAKLETEISKRNSAVETITSGVSSSASAYNKVKYFNKWLTENNEYNTLVSKGGSKETGVTPYAWECTSALYGNIGENGPVCEGYARAFKVLCDRADIPCVLVDGYAISSSGSGEPHMWNYVEIDEAWYGVDVTWNDPTGGNPGKVSGYEREIYLCVGSDTLVGNMTFIESHPVQNKVSASPDGVEFTNGPVLSSEAYSNFIVNLNYDTDYVYTANKIAEPEKENFKVEGNLELTFKWKQGTQELDSAPTNVGDYMLEVTAADDNKTYMTTIPVKIRYLVTDATAVLADTNKGDNGWYRGAVTLNAPSDYMIAGDNSSADGFDTTYTPASQEGEGIKIPYALKNSAGGITDVMNVTVNIDSTAPEIKGISISEITETSVKIKVTAADSLSGIAGYTLELNSGETTKFENEDGVFDLSDLPQNVSSTFTVTVRDNAGNTTVSDQKKLSIKVEAPVLSGEYGTTVKEMLISGGGRVLDDEEEVKGTWSLTDENKETDVPDVGTKTQYELTFTPDDSSTYGVLTVNVTPDVKARSLTSDGISFALKQNTYTFTGEEITPGFSLTDSKTKSEIEESNYAVKLSNNINVGTATLTITGQKNYTGTIEKTFTISKASAPAIAEKTESYLYTVGSDNAPVEVDLTKLMPANSGKLTCTVSEVSNTIEAFVTNVKVENGILSYIVGKGSVDAEASFTVTIDSENYATTKYNVTIKLTDKLIVAEKEGREVRIEGSNVLTYGQKLSELKLNTKEAVFVNGTVEVSGTLAWEAPDTIPDATVTTAGWIFKPDDSNKYASLTGSVDIVVEKASPNVTAPVLSDVTYSASQTLAGITLGSSDASWTVGDTKVTVSGTWSWKEPATVPTVDKNTYTAVFTPSDSNSINYNSVEAEIKLNVKKATPVISETPTASAIEYGQTVSKSKLSGGKAVDGSIDIPGSFAWVNDKKLAVGAHIVVVKFTPKDTVNYSEVTTDVNLTVNKAKASELPEQNGRFVITDKENTTGTVNIKKLLPEDCGNVKYEPSVGAQDFVSDIAIDEKGILTYTVDLESVTTNAQTSFTVIIETDNYEDIVLTINVLISTEKLTVTQKEGSEVAVTNNNAVYGQKLSDLLLNTAVAEFISYDEDVEGTLEWKDGDIVLDEVGEWYVDWVFTPDNGNRYKVLEGSLRIVVEKVSPIVTAPRLRDVTYKASQTLADIKLGSGDASWTVGGEKVTVSGTWSWKEPAIVPTVDKKTYAAVFTPDDTENYYSVGVEVTLNVLKAKNAPGMSNGTKLEVSNSTERVSDVTLPEGWAWEESAKGILLEAGKPVTVKAVYIGADKNNYENVTVKVIITRLQAVTDGGTVNDYQSDNRTPQEKTPQEKAKEGKSETIEQRADGQEVRRLVNSSNAQVVTSIAGTTNLLPSNAYYTSEYKTSGSDYDKAVAAVSSRLKEYGEFRVVEVNLFDANDVQIHQLGGMVSVEMPIPDGFTVRDGYVLVVYRVNDNGTLTRCNTSVNGSTITFQTNHFSTFVLVEQSKTSVVPATGDDSNLAGYLICLMMSIIAMAGVIAEYVKRIRRQQ